MPEEIVLVRAGRVEHVYAPDHARAVIVTIFAESGGFGQAVHWVSVSGYKHR